MESRALGRSGLQVSLVGLGCMNFGMMNDQAQATAIVNRSIELGVNFFDTAAAWRGSAEELAEIDKISPPPGSGFPGPRR